MNGKIIYCYKHDQGALVCCKSFESLDRKILSKNICLNNKCYKSWCDHGTFSIRNKKLIMKFDNKDQTYYDNLLGGWHINYFKLELYDTDYEPIHIIISEQTILPTL